VAASRLDWLALVTRANSERRSRYCPRSRSAIASDSGPHPAISAYNLTRASRSQAVHPCPVEKGPCRDEAPPAYPLFCLSKRPSRSDQPTKFEALGLTRSALDIAHVVIVAFY